MSGWKIWTATVLIGGLLAFPAAAAQELSELKTKAEQGDAGAQLSLGKMHAKGKGAPRDFALAAQWFRQAAGQGNAEAQTRLGNLYYNGQGVTQDYAEAVKWFRLAAMQGDSTAQYNLGAMYGKGRGVAQDYISAHMWFNIAAALGGKFANENRDIVANKMTPADISEAQKLAREWMEEHPSQ